MLRIPGENLRLEISSCVGKGLLRIACYKEPEKGQSITITIIYKLKKRNNTTISCKRNPPRKPDLLWW